MQHQLLECMWEQKENKKGAKIAELESRLERIESKLQRLSLAKLGNTSSTGYYMDVMNAARYLGMCRTSFYSLMNQGEIPFTTVGKQRRIMESDLENYLKKNYKKLRGSIL